MVEISVVGLDLAKHVFQVHGADARGRPVLRRKLRRTQVLDFFKALPPCQVAMEAGASAHHWARELRALGHEPVLIPPQFVRPFVKTNKSDAADAEAIVEAALRPTMRFAAVKSAEQQSVLVLHRARELLVRQRTMLINAIRSLCGEFGLTVAQGAPNARKLIEIIRDVDDPRLPDLGRTALKTLADHLDGLTAQIAGVEQRIVIWHRSQAASRRLAEIPGIGPITASAIVASVGDAATFRSARQFAAWLGLVPQQHSSGGKERLGSISKRGDGYLRRLLIHGARVVLRWRRVRPGTQSAWLQKLLERRHVNVVTVAMANKMARVVWALLTRGESYRQGTLSAA